MAVITAAELAAELGTTDDLTRLHATCKAEVERYAPAAPEEIRNEAIVRMAGCLVGSPGAVAGVRRLQVANVDLEFRSTGSAVRLSGAAALLSPWRVRRAGRVEESD